MSETEVKIGVFICHCGGNISDVVDVKRVAESVGELPGVAIAATHLFMCSDPGQALIEEKVRELGLNRLLVAACSPTLHLPTFRRAAERAGMNQFLVEHVNIREHVSWVIDDKEAATAKAIRLVSAAVGRIRYLVPLEHRSIPIHDHALVIGGGVAGLTAALRLAERGMKVTLAEKRMYVGGRMAQLDTLYPTGERAVDLLGTLVDQVADHPNIDIKVGAMITKAEGLVGDFRVTFRTRPRGVSADLSEDKVKAAIEACPEQVPFAFNYGLSKRKAIYAPTKGVYPNTACIVWDDCTRCGKCLEAAGGTGIDHEAQYGEIEVKAGVIVMATGYHPYEPSQGEYAYGEHPGVVTLQQLNRMLDPDGPTGGKIEVNGKPVQTVAFIHCVGACEAAGVHPVKGHKIKDYCARTCCTATMHAALELRQRFPGLGIASFHKHIRTYGRGHEEYYDKSAAAGMLFLRYPMDAPPEVVQENGGLLVRSRDQLTDGIEVEYPADLVVLSTGVVPRDHTGVREIFKCTIGADHFLQEVHPKLRPVEMSVKGVMLAGACQGPMDVTEACAGAAAAASKAAALISQGNVLEDPFVAEVDESLCTGCQTCLTVCPYEAISRIEEEKLARVNDALCTGCGTCAAACPSAAIQQYGFTDQQIMSEVEMLLPSKLAEITV